jgi:hypothetical protein
MMMMMNNTSENNINSIMDNGEEQSWQDGDRESIAENRNICTDICQSSSIFILLVLIAIIPCKSLFFLKFSTRILLCSFRVVLQVFVGWRYSSACPINQLISHYLIVAGIVGLVLILLISITQIMTRTFARKMCDDAVDKANPNRATMLVGCGVCSIMCINLSLLIFLLGWAVIGWIWVLEVWHEVQYRRPGRKDYCHPILYQFTFSLLLLTTTFKLILFGFICKKTCTRVTSRQRKDTITSDDA